MSTAEAMGHESLLAIGAAALSLDLLIDLATPLSLALGPSSEVVVHDLTRVPDSIVAIAGSLTGRRVGGPGSDLLLEHFRQQRWEDAIGYASTTDDGRPLRSSSIFVRAPGVQEPYACLCINTDISSLLAARGALDSLLGNDEKVPDYPVGVLRPESFVHDAEQLTTTVLQRSIATIGVPIELMRKQHKVAVVRSLEERGFFLLRDAVETAAAALGVTRYTIYNYLNELRGEGEKGPLN